MPPAVQPMRTGEMPSANTASDEKIRIRKFLGTWRAEFNGQPFVEGTSWRGVLELALRVVGDPRSRWLYANGWNGST